MKLASLAVGLIATATQYGILTAAASQAHAGTLYFTGAGFGERPYPGMTFQTDKYTCVVKDITADTIKCDSETDTYVLSDWKLNAPTRSHNRANEQIAWHNCWVDARRPEIAAHLSFSMADTVAAGCMRQLGYEGY
jgi:hypothetical protein